MTKTPENWGKKKAAGRWFAILQNKDLTNCFSDCLCSWLWCLWFGAYWPN